MEKLLQNRKDEGHMTAEVLWYLEGILEKKKDFNDKTSEI